MSDGGISLVAAWGCASFELARPILARRGWRKSLKEAQDTLRDRLRHVLERTHWISDWKQPTQPDEPAPRLPDDVTAFVEAVAKGEDPFPKWSWDREKAVDAINSWNSDVDNIWNYQLGMADREPRTAKARRREGYTERLTPKQWLRVRPQMKRYQIELRAFTSEMYAEGVEQLMEFLTAGKLPAGASMDRNVPKLRHQVAGNIVWFIQQILGWVPGDGIDVCSDCGKVIRTDSETHDWCSKCCKMRCDYCTTRPDDCECDHPCRRHCTCHRRKRGDS